MECNEAEIEIISDTFCRHRWSQSNLETIIVFLLKTKSISIKTFIDLDLNDKQSLGRELFV